MLSRPEAHFRRILPAILLCSSLLLFFPPTAPAQVIRQDQDPLRWTIEMANSSYQVIRARDGDLVCGWFGPFSGERVFQAPDYDQPVEVGTAYREVPYRGGLTHLNPALEVAFADGGRELELRYEGHELGEREGRPFLRLDLKDSHYPFRVSEYLQVCPELDIIEKWLVLENLGSERIIVEKAYSGSVLLPPGGYDLIQLSGKWGREFYPRRTFLTSGQKSIFVRGMKGQQHAPFFLVRPAGEEDEHRGEAWFGAVAWSGNWRIDCEVDENERLQVAGGINFWDTHQVLEGGARFETPKMILGFSDQGAGGASRRLHRFMLEHVLRKPFSQKLSPVLYNSWYATTFHVDEDQQVKLAAIARDLGVELFVMDDGWFKGRVDDRAGLGDWTPDTKKFPHGLGPMIRRINELGLEFGLWVEPEMVNPNSDLFRAHPDWALHTPYRVAHEGRHQLVLNFAREEVREYTFQWLDRLLTENNIRFIKWDMNRSVTEAGWPEADPLTRRELRIRYVRNLYQIFERLEQKHPQVVFESCSSGGGRADPGILAYADQVWTSDNTDPGDRLHIQFGYSLAFPARTMVNWTTDEEWHGKTTPLKFRLQVAMMGSLGIGNDLFKLSAEDRAVAREQIALYQRIRHIVQLGDQYRLWDPFAGHRAAVQYVTTDGAESVVFAYQTLETLPGAQSVQDQTDRVRLHGLKAESSYTVTTDEQVSELSGRVLMESGLALPLEGNYSSRIVVLRERK